MRRDWLSTPVAAVVAAPLVLAMQPAEMAAAVSEPVSARVLAQASMPGAGATAPAPASQGADSAASTTAPSDQGSSGTTELGSLEGDSTAAPPVPGGDDELPNSVNEPDNPYLKASRAESLSETGRTSGDQEYGAFVPPTKTDTEEVRNTSSAGEEMRTILGDEVFDRRVNITTPPDTDVAEVVRLLAERANLNFIYGEGVIRGKVTLNLRDVPLGIALQGLLSSQDLAIVREGDNVMRIAPRKEVRPGSVDTRTIYIKLNWVRASELIATLAGVAGSGGGGQLKAHNESNTIIITDSAPNVALLRDLVAQLDVPEKQVMIEARMAELLLSKRRSLGSQLALENVDGSGNSVRPGILGGNLDKPVDTLFSSLAGAPGSPQLSFGGVVSILGTDIDLAATLDGLENNQLAHTLANPRVITLNNQEAMIDIQREVPYIEAQQGVTQGAIAGTVKFKDVGVKLTVKPSITNNGYVRMNLKPEQRILAGLFTPPGSTATGQGAIPIVNRRVAETNVIVKDEDTVVLGGLRSIDASDAKSQMPWIGQAPVLGWFFKNDLKNMDKNDLMLFVTPHIVKAPILAPAETYNYSRIDAHWDLPDFFFDDSVDQRESHHRFELDNNPRDFYPQTLKLPPPVEDATSVQEGGSVSGSGEYAK